MAPLPAGMIMAHLFLPGQDMPLEHPIHSRTQRITLLVRGKAQWFAPDEAHGFPAPGALVLFRDPSWSGDGPVPFR